MISPDYHCQTLLPALAPPATQCRGQSSAPETPPDSGQSPAPPASPTHPSSAPASAPAPPAHLTQDHSIGLSNWKVTEAGWACSSKFHQWPGYLKLLDWAEALVLSPIELSLPVITSTVSSLARCERDTAVMYLTAVNLCWLSVSRFGRSWSSWGWRMVESEGVRILSTDKLQSTNQPIRDQNYIVLNQK